MAGKWTLTPFSEPQRPRIIPKFWPGLRQCCLHLALTALIVGVLPDFAQARGNTAQRADSVPPHSLKADMTIVKADCEGQVPLLPMLKNMLADDSEVVAGSLFSDEGLRPLFGDVNVAFRYRNDSAKGGDIEPVGKCTSIQTLSFLWRRAEGGNGHVVYILTASLGGGREVNADDIGVIFGIPLKTVALFNSNSPPSHGQAVDLRPITHKYGNSIITFLSASGRSILEFSILGDGAVSGFSFKSK